MPLPNADDLLGKPSADELLGPEPQAEPQAGSPQAAPQGQSSGLARLGSMAWNALTTGAGQGADALVEPLSRWASSLANRMPGLGKMGVQPDVAPGAPQSYSDLAGRTQIAPEANVPQGPFERYGTQALQGAGAALPLVATGGGLVGPAIVGAMGGAVGEAARQAFPDVPWAPQAAGLVAGGLGMIGQHLVDTSELEKVARGIGSSGSLQEAGEALQGKAKDWLTKVLPAKEDAVWSPVDQALKTNLAPQGPAVPLTNYTQALDDITNRGGSLAGSSKLLRPQLPDQLKADLDALNKAGTVPTWDDARKLRSDIGEALSNPKIASDAGSKNLDKMYSAITQDLSASAQANGAGDLFAQANKVSSDLRSVADQHIRPLIDNAAAPEKAAKMALNGASAGGTRLSALREHMPDAVDELASGSILANPQSWSRMSPEAKKALVPDPYHQVSLDNAVAAATGHSDIGRLGQEMVGGSAGEMLGALGHGLLPGISEIQGGAAGGLLGLLGPPALRTAGALATRPQLLRPLLAGEMGSTDPRGGR